MNSIEKLKELFTQLPGIGPRQAGRFVHFLLMRGGTWRAELINTIKNLDTSVAQCDKCMRFFEEIKNVKSNSNCNICTDIKRDSSQLLLVVNDVDIKQIESGGEYKGKYFVLGSLLSLSNNRKSYLRLKGLILLVKQMMLDNNKLKEIIFALPATIDGEYTTDTLQKELKKITEDKNISMTILGRGLSTGSEIEYADPETLNNALKNRA